MHKILCISKIIIVIILTIGTALYVYDNGPWLWRIAVRAVTKTLPASSWYIFEVKNETQKDLIVEVRNINDRKWNTFSIRSKYIQERLGRVEVVEIFLRSGEKKLVVLPSFKNRDMGLIGIFARGNWVNVSERIGCPQDVVLIVIPSHMTSDAHPLYASKEYEYPVVSIKQSELQPIAPRVLMKLNRIDIDLKDALL